jgi:hypothetical protein
MFLCFITKSPQPFNRQKNVTLDGPVGQFVFGKSEVAIVKGNVPLNAGIFLPPVFDAGIQVLIVRGRSLSALDRLLRAYLLSSNTFRHPYRWAWPALFFFSGFSASNRPAASVS